MKSNPSRPSEPKKDDAAEDAPDTSPSESARLEVDALRAMLGLPSKATPAKDEEGVDQTPPEPTDTPEEFP